MRQHPRCAAFRRSKPTRRPPVHRLARGVVFGLLLASVSTTPLGRQAHAGAAEDAEKVRLDEDLRKLATRNAWDGVEGIYARLRSLEAKGVIVTQEQHELGAQAALALGNVREGRARLGLARASATVAADQERLGAMVADIDRRFGNVVLTAGTRSRRDIKVQRNPNPFAVDERAAIQAATDSLRLSGTFDGLLPAGNYTLGAVAFSVQSDGSVTRANADPTGVPGEKPEASAQAAPLAPPPPKERTFDLVVGLGGGSATWLAAGQGIGLTAAPGTGGGARLLVGIVQPVGPVSLLVDAHWQGFFGGGAAVASVQAGGVGAGVSVGKAIAGRVQGTLDGASVHVVGLDAASGCAKVDLAGDPVCLQSTTWETAEFQGAGVSGAMSAGLVWSPSEDGPLAVTADVGVRGVAGHVMPWTALGVQVKVGQ